MMEAVKKITDYKLEINDYFDFIMIWYRDVLLYKATADANRLIFRDEVYSIKKAASHSSYEGIETILTALDKAKRKTNCFPHISLRKCNANIRLIFGNLFLLY